MHERLDKDRLGSKISLAAILQAGSPDVSLMV
jgi:hypothetical protein